MMQSLTIFILSIITFVPTVAFADDPFPGIVSFAGCSGPDCSACNIVYMANEGISWLIGILFVIFAVLVAWRGVQLVTSGGNPGALAAVKGSFMNAFIGIIIILSAWLIVDTIMRGLVGAPGAEGSLPVVVNGEVTGWLAWSKVECQTQTEPNYEAVLAYVGNSLTGTGFWSINTSGIPTSVCSQTGGYSGIPVTYDCTTQISECVVNGAGTPTISPDGSSVTCTPDTDVAASVTSGANCPAADEGGMVTIPGESYKATPQTSQNYVAMRAAAAADGINLRVTSGYRSEATQVRIWNEHGCDSRNCSGIVARPCTKGGGGSNHNRGVALDISVGSTGTATFNWLKTNGGRFGFYNNLDARDPFHWSPSGR